MRQTKIWGTSYGIIGDLIMGLPLLTYFEKKYPQSYKYWAIQKKCAITAPIFLNHPLIDKIKITDEWAGFGEQDRLLMQDCDFVCEDTANHSKYNWYNEISCVEETARLAGIDDITEVLTEEEMLPKLYKWFDVGFDNPILDTYSRKNIPTLDKFDNNVAIWPFATGGKRGRSPAVKWWNMTIEELVNKGLTVYHYGRDAEPALSNSPSYIKLTSLSFFDQVKAALASQLVMGPDTGPMWVMGAYSHPAINLLTNHMKDHTDNFTALAPVNTNATNAFTPYRDGIGCNGMSPQAIAKMVLNTINTKET